MIAQDDCENSVKSSKQFRITMQIEENLFKIFLSYNQFAKNQQLSASIRSLAAHERLSEYFDNFEQLSVHLKQGNFEVNEQSHLLCITYTANSIKKGKKILLAKIPLTIATKDADRQLEQIIKLCQQQQTHLSETDIKLIIKQLAQIICDQRKSKAYNNHEGDKSKVSNYDTDKQQTNCKFEQIIDKEKAKLSQKIESIEQRIQEHVQFLQEQLNKQILQIENKIISIEKQVQNQMKQDIQRIDQQCINLSNKMHSNLDQLFNKIFEIGIKVKDIIDPFQALTNFVKNFDQEKSNAMLKNQQIERERSDLFQNDDQKINGQQKNHGSASSLLLCWIDLECKDIKNVTFSQNIIKTENKEARIFSQIKIDKKYSFKVKIIQNFKYIGIGIIDSEYKKRTNNVYTKDPKNYFLIYWSGGNYYNGYSEIKVNDKTQKKYGFQQGQTVSIEIDLENAIIQWKVGNQIRLKDQNLILQQFYIKWVPYIYLCKRSQVSILF